MPTGAIRNAVIVINNPTDADSSALRAYADSHAKYAIAAFETGASQTPHIQAYLQLKRQERFNALKAALPRAHIESAGGSAQRNKEYVRKGEQPKDEWDADGTRGSNYGVNLNLFFELGEEKAQGQRNDLAEVSSMVCAGKSLRDIAEEHPETYIKFSKGIQDYKAKMTQPRRLDRDPTVIVYYGATGTGKSRQAFQDYPDAHVQSNSMTKWWDGYDGHTTVIMDEFRGQLPFGYMLSLLQRNPFKVEYKGGATECLADTFIFTAPEHPGLWYPKLEKRDGLMAQFKRRITKILHFTSEDEAPMDVTDDPWPTPEPADTLMVDQFGSI